MTIECLPQTICIPYRLPVPGKIMFLGTGEQLNRRRRFTRLLPERCAGSPVDCISCARSALVFVRGACRALAGWVATFPTAVRQGLDFAGALFPHRQTHEIAKHVLIRPGLADAGSAVTSVPQSLKSRAPKPNRTGVQ